MERAVAFAAGRAGSHGGILVLLDADDDCPAELASRLLRRARQSRPDRPIRVVLAKAEYESWFLAAAASLADNAESTKLLRLRPIPRQYGTPKAG